MMGNLRKVASFSYTKNILYQETGGRTGTKRQYLWVVLQMECL